MNYNDEYTTKILRSKYRFEISDSDTSVRRGHIFDLDDKLLSYVGLARDRDYLYSVTNTLRECFGCYSEIDHIYYRMALYHEIMTEDEAYDMDRCWDDSLILKLIDLPPKKPYRLGDIIFFLFNDNTKSYSVTYKIDEEGEYIFPFNGIKRLEE